MADNKKQGEYYLPPPKLGRWEGFSQFLWNPETSQFMGRTGSSWAKILLFYILFYVCLSGFFAAMLAVFYQTLDDKMPKWQLEKSLIGANPGLGFRPMPPESNVESTLIWYKAHDEKNYEYWVNEIDSYLSSYKNQPENSDNRQICDYDNPPKPGKTCEINLSNWGPCTPKNKYNYENGGPCIFLKLNKIYGWIPEYYNDTGDLPQKMPKDLKGHVEEERRRNPKSANTVWVSCEGENPADIENIGPIQYYPKRGFPGYFFPFVNVEGYLSPTVAVLFEKPKTGVLINIECKAWAHNIKHDRADRRGSVHFELMVD